MPCYWQIEDWDNTTGRWVGIGGAQPSIAGCTVNTHDFITIGVDFEVLPEDATIKLTAIPNEDIAEFYAPRTVQLTWIQG